MMQLALRQYGSIQLCTFGSDKSILLAKAIEMHLTFPFQIEFSDFPIRELHSAEFEIWAFELYARAFRSSSNPVRASQEF